MTPVHVDLLGETGERVVLVHGSLTAGVAAWQEQRDLAQHWRLAIVERSGYAADAQVRRVDYESDERELVGLMEDGAHIVGTSVGGVIALRVAARRPDLIRSVAVIEPPLLADHAGDAVVAEAIARMRDAYQRGRDEPDLAFLHRFTASIDLELSLPEPLPAPIVQAVTVLRSEKPWAVRAPLADIARAGYPKLVVSGGQSPVFERVCDALAQRLGAERVVFPDAPHSVQRIGRPFNDHLEGFLSRAAAQTGTQEQHHAEA